MLKTSQRYAALKAQRAYARRVRAHGLPALIAPYLRDTRVPARGRRNPYMAPWFDAERAPGELTGRGPSGAGSGEGAGTRGPA